MRSPRRIATTSVVAALVAGAAYLAYDRLYAAPRAALVERLEQHRARIDGLEAELERAPRVREALRKLAASSIGGTRDEVEHRFRTDLNALANAAGLKGIQVGNGRPEAAPNPVGRAKIRSGLRRVLRDQVDFYVMHGEVRGVGTLEQALRALASLQSQPWIHRVEGFSLRPDDASRDRFELIVGVATVFFADRLNAEGTAPVRVPVREDAGRLVAAMLEKNVFKEPAPIVVAQAPPAAVAHNVPPPPAPPPYADWKLTGLVEGRIGLEAFLVNVRSGEQLTLGVGAAVAEARFVAGSGERAVFEIGGQRYEVRNGQTLEQRRLVQ